MTPIKIYLPRDLLTLDEVSGDIPNNIWATQRLPFWASLGLTWTGQFDFLGRFEFAETPGRSLGSDVLPTLWARQLCDPDQFAGEALHWEAVWRITSGAVYNSAMPDTIDGATYIDQQGNPAIRNWREWKTPNHSHFVEYNTPGDDQSGVAAIYITTWSGTGVPIPGSQWVAGIKSSAAVRPYPRRENNSRPSFDEGIATGRIVPLIS